MNDETIYKLFKALTESGEMTFESGDMTSFRRNEDRVPRFHDDLESKPVIARPEFDDSSEETLFSAF